MALLLLPRRHPDAGGPATVVTRTVGQAILGILWQMLALFWLVNSLFQSMLVFLGEFDFCLYLNNLNIDVILKIQESSCRSLANCARLSGYVVTMAG